MPEGDMRPPSSDEFENYMNGRPDIIGMTPKMFDDLWTKHRQDNDTAKNDGMRFAKVAQSLKQLFPDSTENSIFVPQLPVCGIYEDGTQPLIVVDPNTKMFLENFISRISDSFIVIPSSGAQKPLITQIAKLSEPARTKNTFIMLSTQDRFLKYGVNISPKLAGLLGLTIGDEILINGFYTEPKGNSDTLIPPNWEMPDKN